MLLPEEERGSFVKALMRDHDALIKAVCKVDVERARAFDPADQHNIFEAVRATCGVHALNVAAAGGLRDALAQAGMQVLESTTGLVACDLANQLGWLFKELGKYDEARRLLERALEGRERELGPDHVDTLAALGDLAVVADDQGKRKEARRLLGLRRRAQTRAPCCGSSFQRGADSWGGRRWGGGGGGQAHRFSENEDTVAARSTYVMCARACGDLFEFPKNPAEACQAPGCRQGLC